MIAPAYQQALDYLYSFVDFSQVRLGRDSIKRFDLARMHALAASLGDPQKQYPILHVAGTKGKGSVAALCASALQAAGLQTGLYISPHLVDFCERIQIDGQPISQATLIGLVEAIKPHLAAISGVTLFEITTALGMWHFARAGVQAAVMEVGLGGRLDATNIVQPAVTVITSLSYDHVAMLGDTLPQIAAEKGGIIKPGVPVVLAPQVDEARQVLKQIAAERQAPVVEVGKDIRFEAGEHSLDGQTFRVAGVDSSWQELSLSLLGRHQIENAATAYAALGVWQAHGLPVREDAIRRGFAAVRWPCRFEILQRRPPLVVDSAHNRDSARRLLQAVDDYFPGRPVVLLFGSSEDKDIAGMFDELLPRVRNVIFTRSLHPRAAQPERLAEQARPYGVALEQVSRVEDALPAALRLAGDDALVLAAGSLFVAAAVREVWRETQG
ncbi:MAG: bifunctional folylpolyglutamate synthase/dihydrofolate synthase [Chloroflexota bacterium]